MARTSRIAGGSNALTGETEILPDYIRRDNETGKVDFSQADLTLPASGAAAISQITGLTAALAGKADSSHSHVESDVTGLTAALAGKADLADPRLTFPALRVAPVNYGNESLITNLSDGTDTGCNTLRYHGLSTFNFYGNIRLVYANFDANYNLGEDASVVGTITIAGASFRRALDATYMRVTFNNGSHTVSVPAGGVVISDPLPTILPSNTPMRSRTYITVSGGVKWGGQRAIVSGSPEYECCTHSTSESDQSQTGTIDTTGTVPWGPIAVLFEGVDENILTVWGYGDACMAGVGDTTHIGWFGRAFWGQTNVLAWRASVYAELALSFRQYCGQARIRTSVGARVGICGYGYNDLVNGRTLAQLQGDVIAIWLAMDARGQKVYQTTSRPKTTSTDSWATVENQTPFAYESVRVQFNAWVRDSAPVTEVTLAPVATGNTDSTTIRAGDTGHPLTGYIDLASAVESSLNSGKWIAGSTIDGEHPDATRHAAIAALVDLSALRTEVGVS